VICPKDTSYAHKETLLGERLAAAHATAPAEGVVALFVGVGPFKTIEEAFWSECVRGGEVPRIAVDGPYVACDGCVFRDEVPSILVVLKVVDWC
jgi:hypothetical protein